MNRKSMKQLTGILAAAIVLLATSARAQAADNSDTAAIRPAFTWGASAGASIDMSGNDMSTVDFEISFGMRRGWINLSLIHI